MFMSVLPKVFMPMAAVVVIVFFSTDSMEASTDMLTLLAIAAEEGTTRVGLSVMAAVVVIDRCCVSSILVEQEILIVS